MSITSASGIHHVTAIAGDAQQNVDFYAGVLGMRLVKRTVNFDDPRSYHLYYGDEAGAPGSVLTFFPWPRARQGRAGAGETAVVSLAVRPESIGWWLQRFVRHAVEHGIPARRFGEPVLPFRDRDGLQLELVATERAAERGAWRTDEIPVEHAVHGVHSVTLWVNELAPTARVLVEGYGFLESATEETTTRFTAGDGGPSAIVDVRTVGGFLAPAGGKGTVHHVAFRARDDADELAIRERLVSLGLRPTPVIDRQYFHSVYAREPGGVLLETATDVPGFTIDEPPDALGERLMLPARYEARRAELEALLPPLHAPLQPPLARPLGGQESA